MRVGWGFDAHAFGGDPPLLLAGVEVRQDRGLAATSDGDVVAHAVSDALLGAAALGDLGQHFPSSDHRWEGADSMEILRTVVGMASEHGFRVGSIDVTVISEEVRVAPHREAMRQALAGVLGVELAAVSVKATTTDGLGTVHGGHGVAAMAVAVLVGQ